MTPHIRTGGWLLVLGIGANVLGDLLATPQEFSWPVLAGILCFQAGGILFWEAWGVLLEGPAEDDDEEGSE